MWRFLTERTEDTEEKMRNENSVGSVREDGMSEGLPKGWIETSFDSVLISISNGIADKQNKKSLGIPVTRIEMSVA